MARARKIQRFLSQPFHVAVQFTGVEGKYVPLSETVRGFREILEGRHDDIPERCFLNADLDEENRQAAVHSGFVEILPEKITVMAEVAEWPEEIDSGRAREAQERAQRRLQERAPGIDLFRAEQALRRSLVRQQLGTM